MEDKKEKKDWQDVLDKLVKTCKNVLYFVGLIITICATVAVTVNATLDYKIAQLEDKIDNRIVAVEQWVYDQIEKNVIKQADKIQSGNFEDIKFADIEDALKYYPMLDNPSEQARIAYEIVLNYYREITGRTFYFTDLGQEIE